MPCFRYKKTSTIELFAKTVHGNEYFRKKVQYMIDVWQGLKKRVELLAYSLKHQPHKMVKYT